MKANNKKLIITAVAFIAVIAVIAAALLIVKNRSNKSDEASTDAESISAAGMTEIFYEGGSLPANAQSQTTKPGQTTTAAAGATVVGTTNAATTKAGETTTKSNASTTAGQGAAATTRPATPTPATSAPAQQGGSQTQTPTQPAQPQSQDNAELRDINAFISGSFDMDATMFNGEESQNLKITKQGENFKMGTTIEGASISILYSSGKFYMVNEVDKSYMELSSFLTSSFGLDIEEMKEEMSVLDLSSYKFKEKNRYTATYNGSPCVLYDYVLEDGDVIRFTLVSNNLKMISMIDDDGEEDSQIVMNSFSSTIPEGTFTLSGYTSKSMMDFVQGMGFEDVQ